jgi:hypothetical protein
MTFRAKNLFAVAAMALSTCIAGSASAATNVALAADGAIFVSASSHGTYADNGCGAVFCGSTENGGLPAMQSDVLTNTPIAWLSDGDTRYIFGNGDQNQSFVIDLGSVRSLVSFGTTFSPTDRAVIGPFFIETSLTGVAGSFSQQGATITNPGSSNDLIDLASPVSAKYVEYFFGPTTTQYGGDGSGVSQVFANAVPEPATWVMMLLGLGAVGAATRTSRRHTAAFPTSAR